MRVSRTFGLEETGILNRDGHVRRELAQQRLVLAGESAGPFAQEVQCADDLALAPHRNRELRQHVAQRALVPRLEPDVVHQDRPTLLHRRADDTLPQLEALSRGHSVRIPHSVGYAQLLT
jgi:hypothetical protein